MMLLSSGLVRYGAFILATLFSAVAAHAGALPVAANETAATTGAAAVSINLQAGAGGAPTSAAIVSGPANGTITVIAGTHVVYTPNACTAGTDSFRFTLSNATGTSAPATATVTVTAAAASPPVLHLVDPFLAGQLDNGKVLTPLNLTGLYQKGNWTAVRAAALEADNTSAAIAIVQTSGCTADVKLTTDNGTTLLPYDPTFLTKAPSIGGTGLTIPATSLVKIGNTFYGAALVQAPIGSRHSVSDPVSVTATQNGTATATMGLDIPPVVLVHGLWGDASSLQSLRTYLLITRQWQKTGLVDAICYSLYLAFDAATDPMSGQGGSCEVTSRAALGQEIAHLMAVLDGRHIVGGRIDVVAHSMGGLAVRHYSAGPNYRTPRNRKQGVFHEIVTLDTPELGSALATYLVDHAASTLRAPVGSPAWNLWTAECTSSDTVRSCFNDLGLPLAAGSQPLSTGAVYSLIPDGASLKALPDARIPNTVWRAVLATWPPSEQPSSLLRSVLDTLIKATYSHAGDAPSSSSILGTGDNDVIVTVPSQRGDVPSSYKFMGLAHTKTPDPSILGTFFDGVNRDVLESDSVDRLVGCWLANVGAVACPKVLLGTPAAASPTLVAENTAPQVTKFATPDRLVVSSPTAAPQFGVPFELPLRFNSPVQRTVVVSQSDGHGEIASGSGQATIVRETAGRSYIRITPQRFGPMTFTVAASFADGGIAIKRFTVDVRPPSVPPTAFTADSSPVVIVLDSAEPVAMLHPEASYAAVGTIRLDPHLLKVTVQQSGAPVIRVQGGLIQGLRAGEATIDARFGGAVDHVRVIVKPTWE
jgi:pimeloyl-ACP methyl ester carboxylesterase